MPCLGFWNGGWGGGWMGGIGMILWWALIALAVIALVRWVVREIPVGKSRTSAREILEERYARGEIGKEEFEEKRRNLDRS